MEQKTSEKYITGIHTVNHLQKNWKYIFQSKWKKKLILKLKMKNFVEYETPAFSYNPSLILSRSTFSKFRHDTQEYNITVKSIDKSHTV